MQIRTKSWLGPFGGLVAVLLSALLSTGRADERLVSLQDSVRPLPSIESPRRQRVVPAKFEQRRSVPRVEVLLDVVSRDVLRELRRVPDAESVTIVGGMLGTELADELSRLPKLHDLSLEGCSLNAEVARRLSACDALHELSLVGASVAPHAWREIGKLRSIEHLDLRGTALTDTGLLAFSEQRLKLEPPASPLKSVDVRATRVTEKGLHAFRSAHPEVELIATLAE